MSGGVGGNSNGVIKVYGSDFLTGEKFTISGVDEDHKTKLNVLDISGVTGNFNCANCDSLQSLEGAPENVKFSFYCYDCKSLKSLKGAPKEVGGIFNCEKCKVQFKESDVRAVCDVKEKIYV